MGRKKKRPAPDERERIFCYYCERNFANEQVLLSHQKEKHLRCPTCNKRMISVSGLTIHSMQVHNVPVTSVPNAIDGRTSVSVDVVGMKGIPPSYFSSAPAAKAARPGAHDHSALTPSPLYDAPPPPGPYNNTIYQYPPPQYSRPHYGHGAYPPTQYPAHMPPGYFPPQQVHTPYALHSHQGYAQQVPPQQTQFAQTPYQQSQTQVSGAPVHGYHSNGAAGQYAVPSANAQIAPGSATQARPTSLPQPTTAHNSATSQQVQSTTASRPKDNATVVFDRIDLSMEEVRAKLPRYRLN